MKRLRCLLGLGHIWSGSYTFTFYDHINNQMFRYESRFCGGCKRKQWSIEPVGSL